MVFLDKFLVEMLNKFRTKIKEKKKILELMPRVSIEQLLEKIRERSLRFETNL